MKNLSTDFLRKNDGVTMIEFAIVAPLFFLLVFGMVELGLIIYSRMIIQNIAIEITRTSSIGKDSDAQCNGLYSRVDYIKCLVKSKSSVLINGDKTQVQIVKLSDGDTVTPDICFDINPPSSEPATCTVYQNVNGIAGYQGIKASELGEGGDIIEVRISYPWSILMPMVGSFFQSTDNMGGNRNTFMVTASTVIRNEPFPSASATP